MAIHSHIDRRIEAERLEPSSSPQDPNFRYLDTLLAIRHESDGHLLTVAREFIKFLYDHGHGVIFGAAFSCENVHFYLTHMVQAPVWGLGGPPDWTPERQREEVEWGIQVLQWSGWCWSGFHAQIESLRDSLEHLALKAQRRRAAEVRAVNEQRRMHHDAQAQAQGATYSLTPGSYPPLAPVNNMVQGGPGVWPEQNYAPYNTRPTPDLHMYGNGGGDVKPFLPDAGLGYGFQPTQPQQQQYVMNGVQEYDDGKGKLGYVLSASEYGQRQQVGQGGSW